MDLAFDSDCDTYTETSDSEYQDDHESYYGGHCQSILSSLDDSIGKIDDFLTFERGFIHGDIVCSITDPLGQLGRVVDVDMIVELETCCGRLITNVNSKKLLRLKSLACGDYVVQGPWLGRIVRVFDTVTVLFNDGTKCEILIKDSATLTPISPTFEDLPYPYYAGQHVKVNLPTVSKSTAWLCGFWKWKRDEGTICNVEVGLVYVNWIASVITSQSIHSMPSHFQDPKGLTLLSCFPYANWQLGDWCTLPVDYFHCQQMTDEETTSPSSAPKSCEHLPKEIEMSTQKMYVITKTKRKLTVLWQNGERSVGLDPKNLSPVNNVGDHDFWPEQFVLEKITPENVLVPKIQKLGIVKYVDSFERIVTVKWVYPKENSGRTTEEKLSAYELIEHPEFSYFIGEVAIRPVNHFMRIREEHSSLSTDQKHRNYLHQAIDCSLKGEDTLGESYSETAKDVQGYLSCIGMVTGYKDECVEVKWADGITTKVQPYEIIGLDRLLDPPITSVHEDYVPANFSKQMMDQAKQQPYEIIGLDRLLDPPITSVHEDYVPANFSKQMMDQAKQGFIKAEKKVVDDPKEDSTEYALKATALLFPQAAFRFLSHFAVRLFSSHDSTSLSSSNIKVSQYESLKTEELQLGVDDLFEENVNNQAKENKESEESTSFVINDMSKGFKNFEIVTDCLDHHFLNDTGNQLASSQANRSWLKKVNQEWSILKKDLPDTIYVRAYEERMDLLRACIVGAPGTPYHDCLFFFDIHFPHDYPHVPPVLHYNSGGLRLNPNLYESGKVCLSLLNTWVGTGSEVWNPESSTILQVLLSLQALVLNEKPYFNEAGYDDQIGRIEGEKNSITYNENAFIQSCKSVLYVLNRPPKHFEALVEEHFARKSHYLLSACRAYLDGSQIGHPHETGKEADGERQVQPSTGFKIMLAKLLPNLISAFTKSGIDCAPFLDHVNKTPDRHNQIEFGINNIV